MPPNDDLPGVYTNTAPGPAPNGLGQGLFASKAIPAGGDVLNIKTPFVAVLDTERLGDTCSGCFGRRYFGADDGDVSLKACTGCQVVRYCDKTCQSKDWKFAHSLECPTFKKLTPRVLPNNARALLRIVQRVQRGKYAPPELDRFAQLETHAASIREENPRQWERITLSAKAVGAYSGGGGMDEEEMCGVGAKLDLNSFNLTNAQYDRIGLYLHPYAALINHSCAYNAVAGFDGDELFVRAVRPIRQGDQIFISYVDTTNPTQLRRQELRERYFFDCACSKCSSPARDKVDERQVIEAFRLLQSIPASTTGDDAPAATVQRMQAALRAVRASTSCPITSQPVVALRDEFIASLLSAGMFYAAFVHAAVRYVRVDPVVYEFVGHPIRAVHAWALAKLAIHLSQGGESGGAVGEDGDEADARSSVERLGLNFGLIIWSVLRGLVAGEGAACAVPGFRGMVGAAFGEVQREFVRNGIDPGRMGVEIGREWEKVGRLVGDVIEGEGGR